MTEPNATLKLIDAHFRREARLLATSTDAGQPPKNPRVLVIDDDEDFDRMVQRTFAVENVVVETALDGAEGRQKAAATQFDLILLDLKLPDQSGVEVLRLLKRDCPGVPVVLCTGHATDEDMSEALKVGGHFGIFVKPFEVKELAEVFRHYRLLPRE